MPFKRRCPTCGSKQWHKEPSSGMVACSEGHVLQSYRNESKEAEEVGPHTMRKRAMKNTRQKKDPRSKADPQLYHGAKGRFLYFQCLQNLLRLQVSALVKLWSLPAEFEVVCRDVWALDLCLLSRPIYSDVDEAHGTEGDTGSVALGPDKNKPSADSQEESDSFEHDSDMHQLLREEPESEDESEDGEIQKTRIEPSTQQKNSSKGVLLEEGPGSTIAVLVVTCWLLRIPIMYQDFTRVIEAYELPYLDSVRLLPVDMTLHLTKHAKQSLSPHHAPNTLTLHTISSRLAKRLHSGYGITTPEMNAAPLLWRAVLYYQGTPTVYGMAKRLLQVLSVPLVLHPSIAPSPPDTKLEKHRYENAPMEVTFVAVIIMVLKLVYGLDGKGRWGPKQPKSDRSILKVI
ncbi:hypothetical protein AX15_007600 [Amanita polypyramis BW_CC]|nr:hypothetical protein AX15_007600 [Amanita polypyramis BW_CC]